MEGNRSSQQDGIKVAPQSACGNSGNWPSRSRQHSINSKAKGKERQDLIQKDMRAGVKGQRACQMVGLRQQGAWTRWEQAVDRKITSVELWKADPFCIRFLV